jgi:Leucine-rich repeat (LRR) protein
MVCTLRSVFSDSFVTEPAAWKRVYQSLDQGSLETCWKKIDDQIGSYACTQTMPSKFSLYCCGLRAIPSTIFTHGAFQSITNLDLSYNQCKAIPNCISHLSNLETLNFNNNLLTSIAPAIATLTNLRILSLSYNEITAIPPEVSHLVMLKELRISYNKVTDIPPVSLPKLQHLFLTGNQIRKLDGSLFVALPALQQLHLEKNNIQQFPWASLSQATHLELLQLDNWQIPANTQLPRTLKLPRWYC